MSLMSPQKWEEIAPRSEVGPRKELFESGVLVVDKPEGISSMDVIRVLRRIVKTRKMGHGGTLDPFATGVLPVLLNSATKRSNEIMCGEKEYTGTFILGMSFDTQDMTGKQVGETQAVPAELSLEKMQEIVNQNFIGEIEQIPPMYSAVKKDGRRLYDYARQGKSVEAAARTVRVEEFELLNWDGDRRVEFRVRVQKGVYVRTLVEDFGKRLGIGAVLETLKRTSVGPYIIEQAVRLPTLRFASDIREHLKPITT
jgi:tRNA pseudouridine55 synthase